jgi:outer membrane protein assembly factor BamB
MAETHVTSPPPSPPPSSGPPTQAGPGLRLFRVPALLVSLMVLAFYTPRLWIYFDLDPSPIMYVYMGAMLVILVSLLSLAVWLLFFSGLRWRTRLLAFAVFVLLPPAALVAVVRKVEFTGNMQMLFIYRWQRDHEKELADHLARQRSLPKGDLPTRDAAIGEHDFPRYRGPAGDGVIRGLRLKEDGSGPELVKPKQPCGAGYAGFAVAGNMLVTIEDRKDGDKHKEAVVCYDRDTLRLCWEYEYDAFFYQTENMGGVGPRATPTIADGEIYSLGALGDLVCLDAEGNKKWAVNIVEDNGSEVVKWGMTSSPLIVDDKVIVCAGVKPSANANKSLVAYDRKTGKRVWANGDKPAGYSSPMLVTLTGRRQVLMFDGGGLAGFDPADGRELWRQEWLSFNEMNIIQPVLCGEDRVFIGSDPKAGGAMLKVVRDGETYRVETLWKNRYLCAGYSNPVFHEGRLYGLGTGYLVCLDASTGQRLWRGPEYGNGQILLIGDVLLITEEKKGDIALVRATPDGFRPLSRIELFDGKTWNTPAVAGDRLYVRNHVEMACLRLPVAE